MFWEHRLHRRLMAGEHPAFVDLYDQYAAVVFGVAMRVTCVPFLRYDGGANQNGACAARVRGPLRLAGIGLLVFLLGSAVWILSGGDRALGLSGRRAFIRSRQA